MVSDFCKQISIPPTRVKDEMTGPFSRGDLYNWLIGIPNQFSRLSVQFVVYQFVRPEIWYDDPCSVRRLNDRMCSRRILPGITLSTSLKVSQYLT